MDNKRTLKLVLRRNFYKTGNKVQLLGKTENAEYIKKERYLIRFNAFFNSEKLSSTYKPVFVKSLIAISDYDERNLLRLVGYKWITKQDDKLRVDLNFVAVRYIKYFWDLYFKFRLKQSHSPQDANINRILSKLKNVSKTPSLSSLAGEEFS